jgi:hypothetical protein
MPQHKDTLPRNFKRGVNRLFLVLAIGWALYWAAYPTQGRSSEFRGIAEVYFEARDNCRANANRLGEDACLNAAKLEYDREVGEITLRNEYAGYWPYFLMMAVGAPILAYGLLRGIIAIGQWIWRGYR